MAISKKLWGKAPDGKEIFLYTLTNASGASVQLCSVGAAIVSVNVPDAEGKLADVIIGYPNPLDYFADGPCSGKVPGRYANRIAKGKFSLDGKEYTLPINNGPNHLHGGRTASRTRCGTAALRATPWNSPTSPRTARPATPAT